MTLPRCEGILLTGRSPTGGRSGVIPPRRCRRVAMDGGRYCELHRRQADLQDLFRDLLVIGWEYRVQRYLERMGRR